MPGNNGGGSGLSCTIGEVEIYRLQYSKHEPVQLILRNLDAAGSEWGYPTDCRNATTIQSETISPGIMGSIPTVGISGSNR